MQAEFTGRKQKITKALRELAEEGLDRIEKVVGRTASAHVTFSKEKYRHIVEVAITTRQQTIIGIAESPDEATALRDALEKAEKQAIRLKKKKIQLHRQSKEQTTSKAATSSRKSKVLLSLAAMETDESVELHIVPSKESIATRPMALHEAVKEAEYRDRDVFVFRDHDGDVKVLHRTKDGVIQLIEVP